MYLRENRPGLGAIFFCSKHAGSRELTPAIFGMRERAVLWYDEIECKGFFTVKLFTIVYVIPFVTFFLFWIFSVLRVLGFHAARCGGGLGAVRT